MHAWKEALIEYFKNGAKQRKTGRLGVEIEHFVVEKATGKAVPYSGEKGIRQILTQLMAEYPEAVALEDDDFFGFTTSDFQISLEPASQFEISIAPECEVKRIRKIYQEFIKTLEKILQPYDYTFLCLGCQPVTPVAETELIPKRRYDLMNEYFKESGTGGMQMMRGTASVQVSIDYFSETDFRRKIQAAYYYGPLFKMFCDNAEFFEGKPVDIHLKRTDIWRRVDPSRCGILPGVFSEKYGYEDYADYIGSVAPIFLKEGKNVYPTGRQTIAELYDGKTMNEKEIMHALSMVFPDVRLKNFLEIRFADSVPEPRMLAYTALVKGLLTREEGIAHAGEQIRTGKVNEEEVRKAEDSLMEKGWEASVYGVPVRQAASEILGIAKRNLPEEEKVYLELLERIL